MLSRLRDQVERSLGALLIARLGREDCEELDAILQGWDGKFSPLLRKRVARHVDGCDVCRERRAAVASPMALLAAAPFMPAPSHAARARAPGHRVRCARPAASASPATGSRRPSTAASADARSGGSRRPPSSCSLAVVGGLLAIGRRRRPRPVAAVVGDHHDHRGLHLHDRRHDDDHAPRSRRRRPPPRRPQPPRPPQPEGATSTSDPVVIPPPPPPPGHDTALDHQPQLRSTRRSVRPARPARTTTSVDHGHDRRRDHGGRSRWSGAPLSGSKSMTRAGSTWTATLGPFAQAPVGLMLDYTVVAEDAAGNQATRSGTIMVTPCPG